MRMITRGRWQTVLLFLALVHFAGVLVHAGPRVAVIAADGDDSANLAPLVEIDLAQGGLTMVDRAHLDEVLKEQKLQILLAADAPEARAKLGQLLNANFLVFIRCPDKPSRRLEVITCETTQGVRLARSTLPRADAIDKDATAANDAVAKAIAKSAKAWLKLIAVAPWSSDDLTTQFDYRRDAFRQLVEAPLADRDDLVLVEFAEAEALQTELAIAGQPNLVRKQPLILSGKMKHSSVAPDAMVTVSLQLTQGAHTLGAWSSGQLSVSAAAAALPGAATDLVNKSPGVNVATAPKLQAKELGDRAGDLLKLSFYNDAAKMFEAALLLDPDNTAYHSGAGHALYRELTQEMYAAEQGADTQADRIKAVESLAPACAPRARRILQHMEFVFDHLSLSFQDDLDNDFLHPIMWLYPKQALRDFNYNVMKYKREHRVKDRYDWMRDQILQETVPWGPPTDDDAQYIAHLSDVWTSYSDLESIFGNFKSDSPQLRMILDHMDHSANPVAVRLASRFRDNLAAYKTIFPVHADTAPPKPVVVAKIVPDVEFVRMALPLKDPYGNFNLWYPAGPHADIATERLNDAQPGPLAGATTAYYFREDGWVKYLGVYANGDGPAFDGKYIWWGVNENNVALIHVYDPDHNKTWTAGAAQGIPPDTLVYLTIVPLSPGKVAIIAGANTNAPTSTPTRTWIAIGNLDAASGPSCKMLLECREHTDSGHDGGVHSAFSPGGASLLPGPPGAGEKATPHLFIGRRELQRTLMVDPQTGDAQVVDDDGGWRFGGVFLHEKMYRRDMTVWDPRTNITTTMPMPPGLTPPKTNFEVAANICNGKVYYGTIVHSVGYIWSPDDKTANKPLTAQIIDPSDRDPAPKPLWLHSCGIFGLVSYNEQAHFLTKNPDYDYHAIDWQTWLQKHLDLTHDADGYLQLFLATKVGSDQWRSALTGYLKYSDSGSIERAQYAVDAANFLMSNGDYQHAAEFSAAAAQCGAEWAMQSREYASEGLGDWASAEKFARQAADAYGNSLSWFIWCIRTGHGDLAGARAHYLASMNLAADDADGLETIALYDMLIGDDAKAQPYLKKLCEQKHDAWAALHAAIYAGSRGDNQTRDHILAPFGQVEPDAASAKLPVLAFKLAKACAANQPVDKRDVDIANVVMGYDYDNPDYVNLNYLLGRFLILQGQNDLGIKCIKLAAGHNSYGASRALAAVYLRAHHLKVPLPGAAE